MGASTSRSAREAILSSSRRLSWTGGVPCTGECQAIQDVASGWAGRCLGLDLLNHTTTPAACREACCADPNCEVWQWGNRREEYGKPFGSCHYGRGLECSSDRFDNFLVLAGQRISHGTVSETIALEENMWCTGEGMKQAHGLRPLSATGMAGACQKVCFDDSSCSIWQHSPMGGCWYGYSDKCAFGTVEAATMVAGERVARACGQNVPVLEATDFIVVFGVISAVALIMICCAGLLLLFTRARRKPSMRSGELRLEGGELEEETTDSKLLDESYEREMTRESTREVGIR